MANIRQQAELTLKHPFFRHALKEAVLSNFGPFERLLYEVQAHVWERCALDASRTYGKHHRLNHMDIKRELRDMAPPEGLDLKLPIPETAISFQSELPELDFMLSKITQIPVIPIKRLKPLHEFNPSDYENPKTKTAGT